MGHGNPAIDGFCKRFYHKVKAPKWIEHAPHTLMVSEILLLIWGFIIIVACFVLMWFHMPQRGHGLLPDLHRPLNHVYDAYIALIARGAAHSGEFMMSVLLLPVSRMSPWLTWMGLSANDCMKYHRWMGMVAIILISIHSLIWLFVWAGNKMFVHNALRFVGYYECAYGNGTVVVHCSYV